MLNLNNLTFLNLVVSICLFIVILSPCNIPGETGEVWRNASYGRTNYKGVRFNGSHSSRCVAFKNKLWMIGALPNENTWHSKDGETWIQSPGNDAFNNRIGFDIIVFDDRLWLMGGSKQSGFTSENLSDVWFTENGIEWTLATDNAAFPARRSHKALVYKEKMWIIGGYGTNYLNDVWYSTDGVNWTESITNADFPGRMNHSCCVFQDKIWVSGGSDSKTKYNDVWYSSDGITWNAATLDADFSKRIAHSSLVHDNKLWIIGGYDGDFLNDIWYSSDGISWTESVSHASFSGRRNHSTVMFQNMLWVIGGLNYFNNTMNLLNDAWSSNNCISWSEVTKPVPTVSNLPPRFEHCSVSFRNKMWVIGGYNGSFNNDVWSSSNGANWTKASDAGFDGRVSATSVVFDNKIWIIGGIDGSARNDVWCSNDGKEWISASESAEFPARYDHSSVVFNDRMWVIAGKNAEYSFRNDVWYSANGSVWNQATDNAAFSARGAHVSLVFDGKMWVIAGDNTGSNFLNDAWYSSDGIEWIKATDDGIFQERCNHTGIVFDNRMWIMFGMSKNHRSLDDVWYSLNGKDWIQTLPEYSPYSLMGHCSVEYDDKIWITGGLNYNSEYNSEVIFSGKGPAPVLSEKLIDFGAVDINSTKTLNINIENSYPEAWETLILENIIVERDYEGVFSAKKATMKEPVLPGDNTQFEVIFDPQTPGAFNADLLVKNNSTTSSTLLIKLKGKGVSLIPGVFWSGY
mgnify:CR=1 FL=1